MKKSLLLMLFLALTWAWTGVNAQEQLTVYEGTTSKSDVPAYIGYFDDFTRTQTVIPASDLEDMAGGTISAIKFYTNSDNVPYTTVSTVDVYLKEVSSSSISAFEVKANCTMVYQGTLDIVAEGTGGALSITFSAPFAYNGGNLLIGIENTTDAGYKFIYFYGQTVNGASVGGYNSSSLAYVTPTQRNFIPKTTFTYTPGVAPSCKKPSGLAVNDITANSAVLSWTEKGTATSWQLCIDGDEVNLITVTPNPSYSLTGLNPLSSHTVKARSYCSASDQSDWTSEISFTTLAVAEPVGDNWSDDFEGASCGWELINGTLTNAWAWGEAAHNGGTHSIYISNDNGTTNAYTNNSTAAVYATKLLAFAEGKYEFSYDWLCNGEGSSPYYYDYLRVILAPASVELAAGTSLYSGLTSTGVPNGWIALDGGTCLNGSTSWASKVVSVDVAAGNYYLVLVWRNDGGSGSQPPAAVDNVSIVKMACPYDAEGLAVASNPAISSTSATITWNANVDVQQWEVAYSTDNSFPVESTQSEIANGNSVTLANLQANTKYYVKVRARCSATEFGSWSSPINFTTECPAEISLPYTEDFEGIGFNCWEKGNLGGTTISTYIPSVGTTYKHDGSYGLKITAFESSSTKNADGAYVVLPQMNYEAGSLQNYRIKFYAKSSSTTHTSSSDYNQTLIVGYIEDITNMNTFHPVGDGVTVTGSWDLYELSFAEAAGSGRIVFLAKVDEKSTATSKYASFYIDDIEVSELPQCVKPSNLAVVDNSITTNSVQLDWIPSAAGETAWMVLYKKAGVAKWDTVQTPVSSLPFELSGLDHASSYSVQVASWCDTSDPEGISEFTQPISFQTECGVISTFPWIENFNSLTAGIPVCWDNSDGTTTTDSYKWNYYATGHEGAGLRFNSFSNSSGYTNFLKTPVMNFPAGKIMQLSFWYKNPTGGDFSIFISTDGGATYTTSLATGLTGASIWTEKEIILSDYAGTQNVVIIFKGTSNYGNGDAYLYLDDVKVEQAPACLKPTDLEATPSSQTATLTWNSEASGFDIAYSTDATANPDENVVGNSSTNTYSKSNLTLDTDHYFWVRANCGTDGTSEWVGPISVHIGYCVPGPTSRDGKGITGVAFGQGVDVVNNSDADGLPNASPYYGDYKDQIGAVQAGVESTIAITTSTSSWPYTFVIWVDLDNDLTFEDEEIIYTGKCASGAGTLNANIMIPATQALGDYRMRIAGADSYFNSFYNNGGALDYEANHDPCLTGSIYAVFHDYTLRVLAAPSCLKPTGLEINYTGGLTAEVSWTGEAMLYNIDVNGTVTNGVTSPYELSGLELATTYEVKVQADCGSGSLSDWTSAVSFSTDLCMPEDQCILTFELTDSYGDSWNGNAILVTDVLTGKVLGEMANEDLNGTTGSDENEVNIKTLSVCNGREIQFSWVKGSYSTETSWVVKDVNGQVLFSGAGTSSMKTGDILYTHTVDCTRKFYLEIGTSGYATFYDEDYAYTMPANLSGHIFNATTGLSDAIYEANQIIPAKEPLVMKAADNVQLPDTFILVEAETDALPSAGNDLKGNNEEGTIGTATDGNVYYVLSLNDAGEDESVGFYYMLEDGKGGFTMPAHKAYLQYSASGAPAQFFLFNGENGATWLDNLQGVEGTVKFMHEGNIYILRDSIIYDATGRKVRELK